MIPRPPSPTVRRRVVGDIELIDIDATTQIAVALPMIGQSAAIEGLREMNEAMAYVFETSGEGTWPPEPEVTKRVWAARTGAAADGKPEMVGVLGALGEESALIEAAGVHDPPTHMKMVRSARRTATGYEVDYGWPISVHDDGRGFTVEEIAMLQEFGFEGIFGTAPIHVPGRPWLTLAALLREQRIFAAQESDVLGSIARFDITPQIAAYREAGAAVPKLVPGVRQ